MATSDYNETTYMFLKEAWALPFDDPRWLDWRFYFEGVWG